MYLLVRKSSMQEALSRMGVQKLYPWQQDVFSTICCGTDVLYRISTGGGKSLVFQLPAILEYGLSLTLVISPLRALQEDQVSQLKAKGIAAEYLNADCGKKQRQAILDGLPLLRLLYIAPEQLAAKDLQKALRRCAVDRIVVDEAHILPQAAPSFRKAYGCIGLFTESLPRRPQIIACTATATTKECRQIMKSLRMEENTEKFLYPVRRDNLRISIKKIGVKRREQKKSALERNLFQAVELELDQKGKNNPTIIYCPTVRRVKELSKWLKGRGWSVAAYTGKMDHKERLRAQEAFLSDKRQIMVATNAFGLGINKPDVRLIIHAGLPLTLSGYVQEIGRAGRDGKTARCVLFYSSSDVRKNENILKKSGNSKAVRQGLKGLYHLKDLLESSKCVWWCIDRYYGQLHSKVCGYCYRCKAKEARR